MLQSRDLNRTSLVESDPPLENLFHGLSFPEVPTSLIVRHAPLPVASAPQSMAFGIERSLPSAPTHIPVVVERGRGATSFETKSSDDVTTVMQNERVVTATMQTKSLANLYAPQTEVCILLFHLFNVLVWSPSIKLAFHVIHPWLLCAIGFI